MTWHFVVAMTVVWGFAGMWAVAALKVGVHK